MGFDGNDHFDDYSDEPNFASLYEPPTDMASMVQALNAMREMEQGSAMDPNSGTPTNDRLVAQLGSDSFTVRENATRELGQRGLAALPELLSAQLSTDPEVRARSRSLIPALGPAAIPELMRHHRSNEQMQPVVAAALSRLPGEAVIDYAAQSPEALASVRAAVSISPELSERLENFLTPGDGSRPAGGAELQRAITTSQLFGRHDAAFSLSIDQARMLLGQGSHREALAAMDRCLSIAERGQLDANSGRLSRIDFWQQMRDHMNSKEGQRLPASVRTSMRERMERMLPGWFEDHE